MNQIALPDLHDRTAEILHEVRKRNEEYLVTDGGWPIARLSPLVQDVAAVEEEDLSPDLAAAVAALRGLEDDALRKAARDRFPEEAAARFQALNRKQQREGLTESELGEIAELRRGYERVVLIRAEAAWLLKERGHDVSDLLASE